MDASRRRVAPALTASLALHGVVAAMVALTLGRSSDGRTSYTVDDRAVPLRLVWLPERGASRGGGGSGNHTPGLPQRATAAGHDSRTVDAAPSPRTAAPTPTIDPADDLKPIVAPVMPAASGITVLAGAIEGLPPLSSSLGPGKGGRAGSGLGSGDGPGRGDGIGPGSERGIGDGAYEPGGGVTLPIEIRKGSPQYTTDAMRARAQGAITVRCIVQTSGVCTNIRVVRSFDPAFGLDQEAIKAAAQWRFRPGLRHGEPVPVVVTMEILFALR